MLAVPPPRRTHRAQLQVQVRVVPVGPHRHQEPLPVRRQPVRALVVRVVRPRRHFHRVPPRALTVPAAQHHRPTPQALRALQVLELLVPVDPAPHRIARAPQAVHLLHQARQVLRRVVLAAHHLQVLLPF